MPAAGPPVGAPIWVRRGVIRYAMDRFLGVEVWALLAAAPFIGSFAGVVIDRLPDGRSIVWGRSSCGHCGHKLGVLELIPVLGWLVRGGRCRHCGDAIGVIYPVLEVASFSLALWSVLVLPGFLAWAGFALGVSLLALSVIDWRHQILPDEIALPLIPAGLAVAWWVEPAGLLPHTIGALAGFGLIMAVRSAYARVRGREGIGIGDAKLMAAAGAWVSWDGLPSVLLLAAGMGLVVSLARAARKGKFSPQQALAFGPYIALGFWMVWLYGPLRYG